MTVSQATRLAYALVTPARNERNNLPRLAEAVLAQRLAPAAWVIVEDSSDDGTAELVRGLAAAREWIYCVEAPKAQGTLQSGRREGRALDSFRHGVRALPVSVEVVVKVDADTSFAPDYFDALIERFESNPRLGIAGGACYELEQGVWTRQTGVATHPRGASRAYRWECIDDVMTLESRMGWDGLDEVKVRLRGYRSELVADLGFRHHRLTGGRERGRLAHQAAQGRAAWYMGYRPSYLALRAMYRTIKDPAAVAMIWGYARAALTRSGRCPEPEVIELLRREQRLRAVIRRSTPP